MKCTNFREKLELIHKEELNELITALEAHGGEYEFADGEERDMDDLDNYPQVSANIDNEVGTFRVMKAYLDKSGYPFLAGKMLLRYEEDDYIRDYDPWDVLTGEMFEIISMMDEPKP